MSPRLAREIDNLADALGADGWVLVRQRNHAVVDFIFDHGPVRQVFSLTPSDGRVHLNRRAAAARSIRRATA